MARIEVKKKPERSAANDSILVRLFGLLEKDIRIGAPATSGNAFKERLYSDLYVLISSGLDLRSAIEVIESELGGDKGHSMIGSLKEGIYNGMALADVMQRTASFTEYEVAAIRIGEETGSLASVLKNLAEDFQTRIRLNRDLMTAFSYPAMVTAIAFLAVAFMLTFVVPLFSDLFARMGQDLPWLTQQVVGLSAVFTSFWWMLPLLIATGLIAVRKVMTTPSLLASSQRIILRIPWFGTILCQSRLARFTSSMAFLLGANVNLLRSLRLSSDMTSFSPIAVAVADIEAGLIQGKSLRELLQRHQVFDARFIALVRVGEEVNQMTEVMKHLSALYADAVQRRTKLLSTFMEPLMIGFLGILVGIILISMYLPLFEMNAVFE